MATDTSGSMTLSIVTPTGSVEETTVPKVTLSGVEGDFGVLPGHAPFFTRLRPGVIFYEDGGMPRQIFASGGFVEVNPERVIVLADVCETKEEIDADEARQAKAAADDQLAGLAADADDAERTKVSAAAELASARLGFVTGDLDVY